MPNINPTDWTPTTPNATDWTPVTINATKWGDNTPPINFLLQQDGYNILQQDGGLIGLQQ